MKKHFLKFLGAGAMLLLSLAAHAQKDWDHIEESDILSKDSLTKDGYTLLFINKDSALDLQVKQKLIDAFFTVYPKEAELYNTNTAKKVIFIIDPGYDGVAATAGHIVRYNPAWFHKHPGDIDVVTHEVMHIVQAYGDRGGPGWITEGIADYVRYKFGVDNPGAGWKLPDYSPKQNYDNAYRVTARFFVWIEQKYNKDFVQKMDSVMRSGTYTPEIWKQLTGKPVKDLWVEYSKNPGIS